MKTDDHDMLEMLKFELDFIEQGGYGRSVRTPWKRTSVFQGSLSCINFGEPDRAFPCTECKLMRFVPVEGCFKDIPCHYIPLDANGKTVEMLEQKGDQDEVEEAVKNWLRTTIHKLEQERPSAPA